MDEWIGKLLDRRYRITRRLGKGGMGVVYEATHEALQRPVAIKLLHGHLAAVGEALVRFQREAEAAGALDHPNIVKITDFVRIPGEATFLAMERLSGGSAKDLVAHEGPLPPERAARIAAQALDGLSAAHAAGIIHRDLKPDNVFVVDALGEAELVKLIDFGIAKLWTKSTGLQLTATGQVIGTPAFMSPEQALGRPIDHRSDIYSVGVTLYYLLTGRLAFESTTLPELITAIAMEPPPPIASMRGEDVDADLTAIVDRAMAKAPDARYASAAEMRDALLAFLQKSQRAPVALPSGTAMVGAFSEGRLSAKSSTAQLGEMHRGVTAPVPLVRSSTPGPATFSSRPVPSTVSTPPTAWHQPPPSSAPGAPPSSAPSSAPPRRSRAALFAPRGVGGGLLAGLIVVGVLYWTSRGDAPPPVDEPPPTSPVAIGEPAADEANEVEPGPAVEATATVEAEPGSPAVPAAPDRRVGMRGAPTPTPADDPDPPPPATPATPTAMSGGSRVEELPGGILDAFDERRGARFAGLSPLFGVDDEHRREAARRAGRVGRCFDDTTPGPRAVIEIEVYIDPGGAARTTDQSEPRLPGGEVLRCIQRALAAPGWPEGGASFRAAYQRFG